MHNSQDQTDVFSTLLTEIDIPLEMSFDQTNSYDESTTSNTPLAGAAAGSSDLQ